MKKLLCLLVLALASCHKLTEGTVEDKYIIPAHHYSYTTMHMVGKVPITQFHTGWEPDQYILRVSGVANGDTIVEEFTVQEAAWRSLKLGSHFHASSD